MSNLKIDNLQNNHKILHDKLIDCISNIISSDNSPAINEAIDKNNKDIFSQIIIEIENCIQSISVFLSTSDDIQLNQKRRFEKIFLNYDQSENISFSTDGFISIFKLFINDII